MLKGMFLVDHHQYNARIINENSQQVFGFKMKTFSHLS